MTTGTEPRVGEQRPGGRAARVREAVLTAATELLDEGGYDAVTYEELAQRAGVHKTTVYRRWPSRAELVADALDLHSEEAVPIPDAGSLADDLRLLAHAVAANISSDAGARRSTSIVAAAIADADVAGTVNRFMSHRVDLTGPIVERAIARGELADAVDPRIVIESLVGPIWFRFLLTGEPLDAAFLDSLAEFIATRTGRR